MVEKRNYRPGLDGKRRPSATEIIGRNLGWKTDALMGWANKLGREGKSHHAVRDKAAGLGTATHDLVSEHFGGERADLDTYMREQMTPNARRVIDELHARRWYVLRTELKMDQPHTPFTGTLDLIVRNEAGLTGIVDLKTKIREEVAIQLAAYAMLWEHERGEIPSVTWGAVIAAKQGEPLEVATYTQDQIITGGVIFSALLMVHQHRARLAA